MLKHQYGIWENGFDADHLEFLRKIWTGLLKQLSKT